MKANVSVGLSTIVGYGFSAVAGGLAGYAAIEQAHGTAKWLGILTLISTGLTNFNRSMQAKEQIRVAGTLTEALPSDAEEAAAPPARPEAGVVPDGAQPAAAPVAQAPAAGA